MEKKPKDATPELEIQEKISAEYCDGKVLAEATDASRDFYEKSRYGEPFQKKFQYSLVEALYLLERGKIQLLKEKKEFFFFACSSCIFPLSKRYNASTKEYWN